MHTERQRLERECVVPKQVTEASDKWVGWRLPEKRAAELETATEYRWWGATALSVSLPLSHEFVYTEDEGQWLKLLGGEEQRSSMGGVGRRSIRWTVERGRFGKWPELVGGEERWTTNFSGRGRWRWGEFWRGFWNEKC
jgi:hypothetical protein